MLAATNVLADFLLKWGQTIAGFGSLLLSGALVWLYRRHHKTLDEQRKLLERQTTEEIRRHHTDVLRDRVRYWLGQDSELEQSIQDQIQGPGVRYPRAAGASVLSADSGVFMDSEFRAVPMELERDRYFQDFLENHAPEIKELAESIVDLQAQFDGLRSEFAEEYDDTDPLNKSDVRLEPGRDFGEWAFERAVLLERGNENKTSLKSIAEDAQREKSVGTVPGDGGSSNGLAVLQHDPDDEVTESDALEVLSSLINRLEQQEVYDIGSEGAKLLEQIDDKCNQLRDELIVYEGLSIYPETCEYTTYHREED